MKEKRTNARRQTFEYWTVTEVDTERQIGVAVDMTGEGLRLHCKAPVESGELFRATMHLDKRVAGLEKINLEIRCRWCRKTRATDLLAAGFAIVSPSPEFRKVEQKLIDFFSTEV